MKSANQNKIRRANRTRAKLFGTSARPRLSVFRSNAYTFIQMIDDEKGATLLSSSTREVKIAKGEDGQSRKISQAHLLGEKFAKQAVEIGIKGIVFDRGRYKYHGRVRAVAEGLRKGGLEF